MQALLFVAEICLKVTGTLSSGDLGVGQSLHGSHALYALISSLSWSAYYSLHSPQDNGVIS